eukprot:8396219-Alexandrium_andersonii.AAC.1
MMASSRLLPTHSTWACARSTRPVMSAGERPCARRGFQASRRIEPRLSQGASGTTNKRHL